MNTNKPKLSLSVQYAAPSDTDPLVKLPTRAQFRRWFQCALQRDMCITLRIVDREEGQQLNRDFRDKDYATNVLTFVYDEQSGDVAMCAPVVALESQQQGKSLLAHYAHLTIHAALHLQGYDHENDADAAVMEALETQLMIKLKYPDPYQH